MLNSERAKSGRDYDNTMAFLTIIRYNVSYDNNITVAKVVVQDHGSSKLCGVIREQRTTDREQMRVLVMNIILHEYTLHTRMIWLQINPECTTIILGNVR